MVIYHFSVKIIGRSSGRSSVAAAAYRAGVRLKNESDGKIHDYSRRNSAVAAADYRAGEGDYINRKDILYSGIMLPDNAPREYADRATLWNAVEKAEDKSPKWKTAQTAREIVVALPNELSEEQWVKLTQQLVKENFVKHGMIADYSIHSGHKHTEKNEFDDEAIKKSNPHVHIMLTTRDVDKSGFKGKNREWNKRPHLMKWRESWANICNREFERLGIDERISHLSLKAQGIDREPTIHIGAEGKALEKKGIITERVRRNHEIIKRNIEKGLQVYSEKNREAQRVEHRAKDMAERLSQVRDQHGRDYFKRLYGVEPTAAQAEIARAKEQVGILRRELEQWDKWGLFKRKRAFDFGEKQRWEFERERERERERLRER